MAQLPNPVFPEPQTVEQFAKGGSLYGSDQSQTISIRYSDPDFHQNPTVTTRGKTVFKLKSEGILSSAMITGRASIDLAALGQPPFIRYASGKGLAGGYGDLQYLEGVGILGAMAKVVITKSGTTILTLDQFDLYKRIQSFADTPMQRLGQRRYTWRAPWKTGISAKPIKGSSDQATAFTRPSNPVLNNYPYPLAGWHSFKLPLNGAAMAATIRNKAISTFDMPAAVTDTYTSLDGAFYEETEPVRFSFKLTDLSDFFEPLLPTYCMLEGGGSITVEIEWKSSGAYAGLLTADIATYGDISAYQAPLVFTEMGIWVDTLYLDQPSMLKLQQKLQTPGNPMNMVAYTDYYVQIVNPPNAATAFDHTIRAAGRKVGSLFAALTYADTPSYTLCQTLGNSYVLSAPNGDLVSDFRDASFNVVVNDVLKLPLPVANPGDQFEKLSTAINSAIYMKPGQWNAPAGLNINSYDGVNGDPWNQNSCGPFMKFFGLKIETEIAENGIILRLANLRDVAKKLTTFVTFTRVVALNIQVPKVNDL